MDKKTTMIAGGAFLLGVVTIGIGLTLHYHFDDRGRYGHMMGNYTDSSAYSARESDMNRGKGMMGEDDDMGMGNMHDMHMMVESEREFLQAMIPHHEEAVATAKEVVARGGSTPEIKTLAENIITAQEKEIADMKTWFKNWYGVDYVADGKYQPMMRPLSDLSGADLDKVFLTDMIMHHMGAIMMANSVTSHIEHEEIKVLSETIKTTQSAEITLMQSLLKLLQ